MGDRAFWNRVKRALELKEQIKILQSQLDDVQGELKEYLDEENLTEKANRLYSVKYTPYTRTSFDSTRFKSAYPDMYKLYSKTDETKRFTITTL